MKVLVTGATGFLGAWLVRRLIEEGCAVRISKRPSSPLDELQGLPIETVAGDVTDERSMIAACAGIDTVFHLAGLIAYKRSQRAAMEKINIGGTNNVIRACEINGVRRLVYMSSVVAIGACFDGKTPLNEESAYNVSHLNLGYFETKHQAELNVVAAVQAGKLDAVMLNPSTIYGAGDAKKGSRGTQLKVAQGRLKFYPPGGVGIVAVEDVVEATITAWKKGRSGQRYILCSENLLLKDVFEIIAREAGVSPPSIGLTRSILFALGKLDDVMEKFGSNGPISSENAWTAVLYHWFDSSKAKRELGINFKPASYAIENSIRWSRDHGLIK